jgi:phenylalanyl-tRNA synthetase beta chain
MTTTVRRRAVVLSGAVAGRVIAVTDHPDGDHIRIALVDVGSGDPLQIVFGGPPIIHPGHIVPVAPVGARTTAGRMRRRRYRGVVSHGMLCSLVELGWVPDSPDEVAVLPWLHPGDPLPCGLERAS